MQTYTFTAELWMYPGEGAWYFVTLPKDIADEIKAITAPNKRGFGSVRVSVKVGASEWQTSIFPDSTTKSYFLPVKKDVRTKNGLQDGDTVKVTLVVLEK
ncbi:MAG TPA: DUF1905 domain-containing protein [Candidatus Saccharibacteria bacterium]|jgi:hypothetical protein|nr:DUF1905 domain-containing protein [Candidatus Saccharibacteria bacterium]